MVLQTLPCLTLVIIQAFTRLITVAHRQRLTAACAMIPGFLTVIMFFTVLLYHPEQMHRIGYLVVIYMYVFPAMAHP
jgi:hypothetical protein